MVTVSVSVGKAGRIAGLSDMTDDVIDKPTPNRHVYPGPYPEALLF
jgi:hypothetical protein